MTDSNQERAERENKEMWAIRRDKPGRIDLEKVATAQDGGMTKEEGLARFAKMAPDLYRLQELLYATGTHSLLIVLQGRDTAGKDGSLKAVAGAMNPVGTQIASFKVPSANELAHDFLWRVHAQAPAKGEAVFFNRSHYEDVLAVRVHKLAPEEVWKKRFDHINAFEKLLTDNKTIVLKFYLHISKAEQEQRLREREQDPSDAWKLNVGDWKERDFWNDYTRAYDDILEKCATPHAPWFIVPADKKWFRNIAIGEAIIETLNPYCERWEKALAETGHARRTELEAFRQQAK